MIEYQSASTAHMTVCKKSVGTKGRLPESQAYSMTKRATKEGSPFVHIRHFSNLDPSFHFCTSCREYSLGRTHKNETKRQRGDDVIDELPEGEQKMFGPFQGASLTPDSPLMP